MKITMLLADAAQAVEGKLYILGGGWSLVGPQPTPMAMAIKIEVPWDQANVRHSWRLQLLDSDGQPVEAETPEGQKRIELGGEFEVGRPPGLKPGTPLDMVLAINFGPLPLHPDGRFEWKLFVDERTEVDWQVSFSTRPSQPHG